MVKLDSPKIIIQVQILIGILKFKSLLALYKGDIKLNNMGYFFFYLFYNK